MQLALINWLARNVRIVSIKFVNIYFVIKSVNMVLNIRCVTSFGTIGTTTIGLFFIVKKIVSVVFRFVDLSNF